MWVRKKEWLSLRKRFCEMQEGYWQASSEVVDLRIDIENLQRELKEFTGKPSVIKARVEDGSLVNAEEIVFEMENDGVLYGDWSVPPLSMVVRGQ